MPLPRPEYRNRARRRVAARLLQSSKSDEARYVGVLQNIMRTVHASTVGWLDLRRRHQGDGGAARTPLSVGFDAFFGKIIAGIPARVGAAFELHATKVDKANARAMRVLGISPAPAGVVANELAKRRDANIDLVVNAARAYADDVKEIFGDPDNVGLAVDELKDKLLDRGNVSESRAELIARDQTLKLNGALTQIRQTNAGVASYVWSTSLDERVRETHAALEGKIFSWDSPPEPGHPGDDYQCRCVAVPVLDADEG